MKKIFIFITVAVTLALIGISTVFGVNAYVAGVSQKHLTTMEKSGDADAVIILGAAVFGDMVSDTLAKRLDMGYQVYASGKAPKIIVSGDHGRKEYNEVSAMRDYLVAKGVPKEDVFMDHAGFNTYDTLYRARDVFLVKQAIVVTQREHLLRALYIAEKLGLKVWGVESRQYDAYEIQGQKAREVLARTKAFLQCEIFHSKPKFLGETIPVSGSGLLTED